MSAMNANGRSRSTTCFTACAPSHVTKPTITSTPATNQSRRTSPTTSATTNGATSVPPCITGHIACATQSGASLSHRVLAFSHSGSSSWRAAIHDAANTTSATAATTHGCRSVRSDVVRSLNANPEGSGESGAGGFVGEIVLVHAPHQLFERDARLPSQLRACLGGVAHEEVDLGRPHEARVLLDVRPPVVDVGAAKRDVEELAHRVHLAGG